MTIEVLEVSDQVCGVTAFTDDGVSSHYSTGHTIRRVRLRLNVSNQYVPLGHNWFESYKPQIVSELEKRKFGSKWALDEERTEVFGHCARVTLTLREVPWTPEAAVAAVAPHEQPVLDDDWGMLPEPDEIIAAPPVPHPPAVPDPPRPVPLVTHRALRLDD